MKTILALGLSAMKYAVGVRGLAGNGLTAIANKRGPAGQTILTRSFPSGSTPLGLPGKRRQVQQLWFNAFYVPDDVPEKT